MTDLTKLAARIDAAKIPMPNEQETKEGFEPQGGFEWASFVNKCLDTLSAAIAQHTPGEDGLKCCPWCSVQPKLDIDADDDGYEYGGAWSFASISALHKETCPLYQSQECGENGGSIQIVDFNDEQLKQFIEAWNTRALSTAIDEMMEGE